MTTSWIFYKIENLTNLKKKKEKCFYNYSLDKVLYLPEFQHRSTAILNGILTPGTIKLHMAPQTTFSK